MNYLSNPYFSIKEPTPRSFIIEFNAKDPDEKDFDLYLEGLAYIYSHKDITILYDARKAATYLPSTHRIRLGNWMKDNCQLMEDHCLSVAFATKSIVHKLLLKAIFAIQPMPVPYEVFSKYEEAESWLKKQRELAAVN